MSLCCYINNDHYDNCESFDRDYFKSVIDKMSDYYKDYYINELLNRATTAWKLYIVTI